jgi:hypothetical protein
MGNLIKAQEDYLYVWTLGVKGVGDGWDKLVTHRRESLLAVLIDPQAGGKTWP